VVGEGCALPCAVCCCALPSAVRMQQGAGHVQQGGLQLSAACGLPRAGLQQGCMAARACEPAGKGQIVQPGCLQGQAAAMWHHKCMHASLPQSPEHQLRYSLRKTGLEAFPVEDLLVEEMEAPTFAAHRLVLASAPLCAAWPLSRADAHRSRRAALVANPPAASKAF